MNDRPTGNVVQRESWVELRPRYPVPSRRGTRTRYTLYRAIPERFDDHPGREKFPASRNR
ncbi:hypothetical protein EI982_01305 [Haloplanus rallus]|uniref:Uncharacterized protein n=1 Tax=Haloplanus rallus TaxID=1816183 RepID=A0A6B9F5B4_9EURY|nr:hypothetical protein [Haloplanus rallus]QGX93524.1 hypothetical protein EI982_01305 [Haloplanus rallus]